MTRRTLKPAYLGKSVNREISLLTEMTGKAQELMDLIEELRSGDIDGHQRVMTYLAGRFGFIRADQ